MSISTEHLQQIRERCEEGFFSLTAPEFIQAHVDRSEHRSIEWCIEAAIKLYDELKKRRLR